MHKRVNSGNHDKFGDVVISTCPKRFKTILVIDIGA